MLLVLVDDVVDGEELTMVEKSAECARRLASELKRDVHVPLFQCQEF